MRDSLSIFITVIIFVVLIIIFPLYNHFERQDNMSYNLVLKSTTNFIDEIINCGYLDQKMYSDYVSEIANTGNLYDIQLEAHKKIITNSTENVDEYQDQYIVDYNEDIFESNTGMAVSTLDERSIINGVYKLDLGDEIYIKVKNSSTTMAEALFNIIVPKSSQKNITVNYGGIIKNNAWLKVDKNIISKELITINFKNASGVVDNNLTQKKYLYAGDTNVTFNISDDKYNLNVTAPEVFEGYVDIEDEDGTKYKPDDNNNNKIKTNKSMTLKPVITTPNPIVTFDANGGTLSGENSKEVEVGSEYGILPSPTRTGFDFDGWYTEKNGGEKVESTTIVPQERNINHKLYAHWLGQEYTITYVLNGGINNTDNPSTYRYGEYITLKNPTRGAHYRFDGWYKDLSYTTKITEIDSTNIGNITLYAKWVEQCIISLDAKGGIVSVNKVYLDKGGPYSNLPVPTRANCTFIGWYYNVGLETNVEGKNVQNEYPLYAKWEANDGYILTKKKTYVMREYYGKIVKESPEIKVSANTLYKVLGTITRDGTKYYKIGDNRYIIESAIEK